MHIRTKLFAMMIFAALASAGLIFALFFFLQKETSSAAAENLKEIYSQSWYNLYTDSLLDIADLMVEVTSFTSVLDVDKKFTWFRFEIPANLQRAAVRVMSVNYRAVDIASA